MNCLGIDYEEARKLLGITGNHRNPQICKENHCPNFSYSVVDCHCQCPNSVLHVLDDAPKFSDYARGNANPQSPIFIETAAFKLGDIEQSGVHFVRLGFHFYCKNGWGVNTITEGEALLFYQFGEQVCLEMVFGREYYENGQLEGWAEYYYPKGEVFIKCNYKEGRLHGLFQTFYVNGNLHTQVNYDGTNKRWLSGKEGEWLEFHENGNRKEKGFYERNQKTGWWRYYDENGLLIKSENL